MAVAARRGRDVSAAYDDDDPDPDRGETRRGATLRKGSRHREGGQSRRPKGEGLIDHQSNSSINNIVDITASSIANHLDNQFNTDQGGSQAIRISLSRSEPQLFSPDEQDIPIVPPSPHPSLSPDNHRNNALIDIDMSSSQQQQQQPTVNMSDYLDFNFGDVLQVSHTLRFDSWMCRGCGMSIVDASKESAFLPLDIGTQPDRLG